MMSDASEKLWRVALCVTATKMAKLGWGDVAAVETKRHRCEIVAVAPDKLATLCPEPDILVFKLTDQMAVEATDAAAREEITLVEAFLATHPRVVQIDPIPAQRRFSRRDALCELLPTCANVRAARHRTGSAEGLAFPVLCKPTAACGAHEAHVMHICFGPKAIAEYAARPEARGGFICQEYVNHDAVIHKAFCVGRHIVVQQRTSLPNLQPWDGSGEEPAPLVFDNQRPVAPQVATWPRVLPSSPEPRRVSQAEFEAVAAGVAAGFGAALFGVDVIVDAKTGQLVAIDANYFPSFRGCLDAAGFFDLVIDHVTACA